MSEYLRKG